MEPQVMARNYVFIVILTFLSYRWLRDLVLYTNRNLFEEIPVVRAVALDQRNAVIETIAVFLISSLSNLDTASNCHLNTIPSIHKSFLHFPESWI